MRAWSSRINLGAQAIYKSPHYYGPGEGRDRVHPFLYYVWSVACSEVEIDVLTGEFEVLRADLLYDAGQPPNPALDIGQLEGAYVQGLGMMTTEDAIRRRRPADHR